MEHSVTSAAGICPFPPAVSGSSSKNSGSSTSCLYNRIVSTELQLMPVQCSTLSRSTNNSKYWITQELSLVLTVAFFTATCWSSCYMTIIPDAETKACLAWTKNWSHKHLYKWNWYQQLEIVLGNNKASPTMLISCGIYRTNLPQTSSADCRRLFTWIAD